MELPSLVQRAELVRRYAYLLAHFGRELGKRPLVLQDSAFFPDPFEKDEASVERLVRRLQRHAGMSDIPIQVRLVAGDASTGGGCGSGGCSPSGLNASGSGACSTQDPADAEQSPELSRLVEQSDGWVLHVAYAEVHHPVALTANLARALAQIFLAETRSADAPVEQPMDVSLDLTTVALGLGLLTLEGSYIYGKGCGGPSVTRLTKLSVEELAVACSLFIVSGGHGNRRALVSLSTTQRVLLSDALAWAASNREIMRRLVTAPGLLAEAVPELEDTRNWLARLFDRRAPEPSLEEALAGDLADAELLELARSVDGGVDRSRTAGRGAVRSSEHEELKALVDEALRSS